MGEMGSTIGGIMKGFSGPAAPEPQPLAMGGGSGYTPTTQTAQGTPGVTTPPAANLTGTSMLQSFTEPPPQLAPAQGVLSDQAPVSTTDRLSQLQNGLNIANQTAQGLRGLYSDFSRGPGTSPLMAPRAQMAGPYTPTSKRKPMRLSDIMGQR